MRVVRTSILLSACLALGCAVNPATGERQISLIGTQQEIQMGREGDQQVQASIGFVDNPGLQDYVDRIGKKLAADTERPDLPWTFHVVDDPAVNAFALPGGFINITRGIMAYFESEAELAGVMGHEIGHVTARHSVNQMSKQQLQQIGLGLGSILSDNVRQYSGLLSAGLGLLNLKYSRDDETQADELGLRYMNKVGYDAEAMVGVFQMLESVSASSGGRVPEWQSTHPLPENREEHIREVMQKMGITGGGRDGRDAYLDAIDGLVYGENPREGYFKDNLFLHPELAFQLRFPGGWQTVNQRTAVGAISPAKDGVVVLEPVADSLGKDPDAALRAFLGQQGVRGGRATHTEDYGIPTARATFSATQSDNSTVEGEVAFLSYRGSLYRIMGYAAAGKFPTYASGVSACIGSFAPVTDKAVLDVQPRRIEIVTLPSAMSVATFRQRYPTPISVEEVARINRVGADATLPAGRRVKRVVGSPLP